MPPTGSSARISASAAGWQDQYAAAYGGCNLIEFSRAGVRVNPVSDATGMDALAAGLLLCYTGRVRRNVGLIDRQIALHREGREETLLGMKRLQEMAYAMRDAIERADLAGLGALLHEAFVAKKQMNPHIAEHTPIETMLEAARVAGAYGGKVCGAGGGGYLLLAAAPEPPRGDPHRARAARRPVRAVRVHPDRGSGPPWRRHLGAGRVRRRFALVDRDGTINEERHHLRRSRRARADPRRGSGARPSARGPRHGHRGGHQPGRGRPGQPDTRGARPRSTSGCARCWRWKERASMRSRSAPIGPRTPAPAGSPHRAWPSPPPSASGSRSRAAS